MAQAEDYLSLALLLEFKFKFFMVYNMNFLLGMIPVATATTILLSVYGIAVIYLVFKGFKQTQNMNDYAVGSISFSPAFVGLSLAASMTSADLFPMDWPCQLPRSFH